MALVNGKYKWESMDGMERLQCLLYSKNQNKSFYSNHSFQSVAILQLPRAVKLVASYLLQERV